MRNQFRKAINVNCANSIFLTKTILGKKCAERSDKHFLPTSFERRCDMYERINKSRLYDRLQMTGFFTAETAYFIVVEYLTKVLFFGNGRIDN